MDGTFKDILDSLPEKPPRSRLEAYGELIDELRRRGRTYREIVAILAEKCQLQVSVSSVHDFVRIRSRNAKNTRKHQRTATPKVQSSVAEPQVPRRNPAIEKKPPDDEVQKRIAALKQRSASHMASQEQFQYDPNEPLHLPAKTRKE